jgi:hypothetical protein
MAGIVLFLIMSEDSSLLKGHLLIVGELDSRFSYAYIRA